MAVVLATSLITLSILAAVVILYPHRVDAQFLRQLASGDSLVRQQAIVDAARRAQFRETMKRKLLEAMDTPDDTQFFSIVNVLRRIGTPIRDPLHRDRAGAIELATAPDPNTQVWLLSEIINQRRDNRHIRRALKSAAQSKHPDVRKGAALLAAILKDDQVLGRLLDDEDASVRAAAALDAALAGRTALAEALDSRLSDANTDTVASAALGLAYLDGDKYSSRLCELLTETSDESLRERLLHVMTILNNDAAREAVGQLAASGERARSAMLILACGKLNAPGARENILAILDGAVKDRKTNRRLVHAAIESADALNIPASDQLYKICRKYWNPDWRAEMLFASAARLLGRQCADAANRKECEELLIGAAYYAHREPTTGPAAPVRKTPIASAAAATAYWLVHPSSDPTVQLKRAESGPGIVEFTGKRVTGARVVMDAARASILAGDYIAWHVGRSGRPEAFELGLRMLPASGAPHGRRIYNENLRGAGAMMLAFAAKTDQQKTAAVQRITERLEPGETRSGEDNPVLAGRYRCALLILGEEDRRRIVRDQRNDGGHAVPAAFGALLLAGDSETLDYLLYNTHIPPQDIAAYLIYDGLDRVLAARTPSLPRIDQSVDAAMKLWQAEVLQDYYVIRRDSILRELGR